MNCAKGSSRFASILPELATRLSTLRTSAVITKRSMKNIGKRPEHRLYHDQSFSVHCTGSSGITRTTTELPELTAENFHQFLKTTEANLVVVDFYTDWCGPCKLIYPELILMQEQFRQDNVLFVKFNCNKNNKSVGKELNIKVAPTFFLYKQGEKVAEMTGAKTGQLRDLIKNHL